MSLRTRIAAAAGLAVALAVLAAAVVVYASVRGNLRGEVERDLQRRAQSFVDPSAPGPRPPGPGGRGHGGRFRPPPDRFGGAEGLVQRIDPSGATRPSVIPVSDRARRYLADPGILTIT